MTEANDINHEELIDCCFTVDHTAMKEDIDCRLTNKDIKKILAIIGARVAKDLDNSLASLEHMSDLGDNDDVVE